MTFKDLIENSIYTSDNNISLINDFKNAKKVKKDLFKSKEHYFYAPDDKYVAGLEYFSHENGILFLSVTHSVERGGLLKLFDILPRTKYIISDVNLSHAAYKFWVKIAKDTSKTKVFMNYLDEIVHIFTKFTQKEEDMLNSSDYRIGLKI